MILQLAQGARRPTRIEAVLTDENGTVHWDWARTPPPVGPLELLVSARSGSYHLRVTTDTDLTSESDLRVSSGDGKALWLLLDE